VPPTITFDWDREEGEHVERPSARRLKDDRRPVRRHDDLHDDPREDRESGEREERPRLRVVHRREAYGTSTGPRGTRSDAAGLT
jgi:hypothetical protein